MKIIILILCLTSVVLTPIESRGEYRVYQYQIRNRDGIEQPPYLEQSSLDPISYQAYHGGPKSIELSLLRTWICRGNTSYIKTCAPPLKPHQPLGPNL